MHLLDLRPLFPVVSLHSVRRGMSALASQVSRCRVPLALRLRCGAVHRRLFFCSFFHPVDFLHEGKSDFPVARAKELRARKQSCPARCCRTLPPTPPLPSDSTTSKKHFSALSTPGRDGGRGGGGLRIIDSQKAHLTATLWH